jgi:hypothetical protein
MSNGIEMLCEMASKDSVWSVSFPLPPNRNGIGTTSCQLWTSSCFKVCVQILRHMNPIVYPRTHLYWTEGKPIGFRDYTVDSDTGYQCPVCQAIKAEEDAVFCQPKDDAFFRLFCLANPARNCYKKNWEVGVKYACLNLMIQNKVWCASIL